MQHEVRHALRHSGFLSTAGIWAIVDGQYGSTGKGLAAAAIANEFFRDIAVATVNAGPNSGHTSYHGEEKIILQQLPTVGVIGTKLATENGTTPPLMVMNAGSIVDIDRLNEEADLYGYTFEDGETNIVVHATAAVITPAAKKSEEKLVKDVGSTGKGTGAALAAKVMRDPKAVVGHEDNKTKLNENLGLTDGGGLFHPANDKVVMEVSQGYSLSLNASNMYPFTTSRDCTVAQALSDAGAHPWDFRGAMMVVRTFPIRVAGNSGPCYEDQKEITWEELGQEPEITTVTKKVRRVFTWSDEQFVEALWANRPQYIFVNFMNYLGEDVDHNAWVQDHIINNYRAVMNEKPRLVLLGYGPKVEDIRVFGG